MIKIIYVTDNSPLKDILRSGELMPNHINGYDCYKVTPNNILFNILNTLDNNTSIKDQINNIPNNIVNQNIINMLTVEEKTIIQTQIQNCQKTGCWIWYAFPQLTNIYPNNSKNKKRYGITSPKTALHLLLSKNFGPFFIDNIKYINKCITKNKDITHIFTSASNDCDKPKAESSLTLFHEIAKLMKNDYICELITNTNYTPDDLTKTLVKSYRFSF